MDTDELSCLNRHEGGCQGEVSQHPSLAGTGTLIARCDRHYEKYVEADQELRAVYPDSPIAPSWFDPTYAGERWDDED